MYLLSSSTGTVYKYVDILSSFCYQKSKSKLNRMDTQQGTRSVPKTIKANETYLNLTLLKINLEWGSCAPCFNSLVSIGRWSGNNLFIFFTELSYTQNIALQVMVRHLRARAGSRSANKYISRVFADMFTKNINQSLLSIKRKVYTLVLQLHDKRKYFCFRCCFCSSCFSTCQTYKVFVNE